ncbi:very-long-chain (3R)-3-hydroxyacyl-CoA dehydratase 2-like [Dysidea avara]|uniref:very-long-chain (3R)-3-hydroxyacyl-CoA dehydratase 2-like n=1 Tax=Dysidea avara TaxID=196820 RepID=UPI003323514D
MNHKELSFISKLYLILYNVVLCVGWAFVLVGTVKYCWEERPKFGSHVIGLYDAIGPSLRIFQTAAFLEVIHCAIGIVRSNVVLTFFQVSSRLLVLWGVVHSVAGVNATFGLLLILFAWSITEVIRYAFYASSLMFSSVPYILQWSRYTFFYILYPIGVLGELMLVFSALPIVNATGQFSFTLPNLINWAFSYYYFLVLIIFLYIPIFPQLYGHMISQRKKVLGGQKTKAD